MSLGWNTTYQMAASQMTTATATTTRRKLAAGYSCGAAKTGFRQCSQEMVRGRRCGFYDDPAS